VVANPAASALIGSLLALVPAGVAAVEVQVVLRAGGEPVSNAVVSLQPLGGGVEVAPVDAVMDQVNTAFVPRVLVVPRGSRVSFPNSDTTRHQVYSFSPAKRFELPLYSGTPPQPVTFETAGVVTLGCNIHDAMVGYIVVVETPHHTLSDATGTAALSAPAGEYTLTIWHERLSGGALSQRLRLPAAISPLPIELALDPPPPPRGDDRLRALQERFRNLKRDPD
jgi:plastocyanin